MATETEETGKRSQVLRWIFDTNQEVCRQVLVKALNLHDGDQQAVADAFGCSVGCVRSYIQELGIERTVTYSAIRRRRKNGDT